METGALGKIYQDGEIIIRLGEVGDCMFVIQEGRVEVLAERDGQEILIAVREGGDFFGEMAILERDVRSATVRALGEVRVLTVDKKISCAAFMRIHPWRFDWSRPSPVVSVLQVKK
jgi:CRP-like cAMP-binding protein